ncbi:MAG: hypothetical protein WC637_22165 [Victivallales bacterium]|jgi:hypothetical protein
MLDFKCPHCGKDYSIDNEQTGRMYECSGCGNLFHTPSQKCCPRCQHLLEPGIVVCIKCGFNLKTGDQLETKIHIQDDTPWWLKSLRFVYDVMPGIFRPLTIVAFILCLILTFVLIWIGLFIMGFGAVLSGFSILSVALMLHAQGVAFLLAGEIQALKSALVEFTERQMWAFALLVFGPCFMILIIMVLVGRVINKVN